MPEGAWWFDVRVLTTIASWQGGLGGDYGQLSVHQLADRLELSGDELPGLSASLRRLNAGGYIECPPAPGEMGSPVGVEGLTREGLVAAGVWPNPARAVEGLADAINGLADTIAANRPEDASKLREAAGVLGTLVAGVGSDVLSRLLSRVFGLG